MKQNSKKAKYHLISG